MIEAHQLTRQYGGFTAVEAVSFAIDEGEIVGLLGPNGAGKTTTLRMLTGFLPPTRGGVTVAGHDLLREPASARREIGYLPENVALYPELRVREYLAYRGRLVGLPRSEIAAAVDEAVAGTLLGDVEGQVIGTLSKGYRQRVGLAAAILHKPRVLVLDEPTVGLDPRQIIAIRELIRDLGRRSTLLLSTHILPEVELLCDRVLILDGGRIVARGTPAELARASRGLRRLRVTLQGDPSGAAEVLAALPGVAEVTAVGGGAYHLVLAGAPASRLAPGPAEAPEVEADAADAGVEAVPVPAGDPRAAVFRAAVEAGWVLLELSEEATSLEDVFVRLTTRDAAEAGTGSDDENSNPHADVAADTAAAGGEADAAEADAAPEEPS